MKSVSKESKLVPTIKKGFLMLTNQESTLHTAKPKATKAWHFDPGSTPTVQVKGPILLKASTLDIQKVQQYYEHHSVSGYDIKSVEVIYNPTLNRSFSLKMELLQERKGNLAFAPKWDQDTDAGWRNSVHQQWQTLAASHQDSDYPDVKLMPLWHGTKPEVLESIFKTGYANLAITDVGFFGKGIYSAHEAEYAHRVYSKGALILNWVISYSAYPVIKGDTKKLAEKGNFGNYDAHFVPVVPKDPNNPNEVNYYPTAPQQIAQYHELVVFDSSQCLPRYLVILQETTPTKPLGNLGISPQSSSSDVLTKLKTVIEALTASVQHNQGSSAIAVATAVCSSFIIFSRTRIDNILPELPACFTEQIYENLPKTIREF